MIEQFVLMFMWTVQWAFLDSSRLRCTYKGGVPAVVLIPLDHEKMFIVALLASVKPMMT